MDFDLMVEMFEAAMDQLDRDGDLINQVLEISRHSDQLHVLRYSLPP